MTKKSIILSILISLVIPSGIFTFVETASAISGSSWKAGNIIADSIFTDTGSMTVDQIQSFLNNKVGTGSNGIAGQCDTNGVRMSELGGGTRAQYGTANNNPAPFTCLKDYYEVPKTEPGPGIPANNYGGKPIPAGAKSAAQLIWDASQEYNISPKVLLVKLGTESAGPLTSDDWPFLSQYTYAMGSHCPDSGPGGSANCDSDYAGFSIQISSAASLLRWYLDSMTQPWWSYKKPYQNNNILWNIEESGCGGSSVYVENKATAALYTYTPYQPNQAALNNMYGTGDGCSAYGNRNFWRTYNDWFGSTIDNSPLLTSNIQSNTKLVGIGQAINVTYSVTNPNSYAIVVPSIGISNRLNGSFYDFNVSTNISFAANETKEFTGTFTPTNPGTYNMRVAYNINSSWWVGNMTPITVKQPVLSISKPISVSPEFPLVNSPHTISFQIQNTGDVEANLTYLMAANYNGTKPFGYNSFNNVILAPGEKYDYQATRTSTASDQQKAWISYMLPNGLWYRMGNDLSFRSYNSPATTTITKGITTNPANPIVNLEAEASFIIHNSGDQPIRYTNIGIQVTRASDNARFDYPSQSAGSSILIPGNSDYIYKSSRPLPTKDQYNYQITSSLDGISWSSDYIGGNDPNGKTAVVQTYTSPSNLVIVSPLQINNKKQGELSTFTYTVKNTGEQPTGDMIIAFYCRFNGHYCDIPGDLINLGYNESATVTRTVSFTTIGDFVIQPLRRWHGVWETFGTPVYSSVQEYKPNLNTFTTTLSLDSNSISLGQFVTATYTIKNNSGFDLQVPRFAIAARLNGFHDFGVQDWFYLKAGETRTFTSQFTPVAKGTYRLFPVTLFNGVWMGYSETTISVQ